MRAIAARPVAGGRRRPARTVVLALLSLAGGSVGAAARADELGGSPSARPTWAAWGGAATPAGDPAPPAAIAPNGVPPSEVPLGPGVVGIVGVPPGDALLANTAARIRMELGAAAIPSRFIDCANIDARETEACGSLLPADNDGALAARARDGAASPGWSSGLRSDTTVISLSRRPRAVILEAVANVANGTKVFRLVHVPVGKNGSDATVVAIRAAELLRDVRLEVARAQRTVRDGQPVAEPPAALGERSPVLPLPAGALAPPARAAEDASPATLVERDPAPPSVKVRWSIAAAAALLVSESKLTSYAPSLTVEVARGAHLSLAVTAAGPFSGKLQPVSVGAADTRQEFATLGARWGWDAGWVRPSLGLAAGAYHLRVLWMPLEPPPGLTTVSDSFWAPVFVPRAGVSIPLGKQLSFGLEYGLLFTAPPLELWGGARLLGRVGGPSHLLGASLAANLP